MTAYSPVLAVFALAPKLRVASGRALSVYLPARAEGYDPHFYDTQFGDLVRRYKDRLAEKDRVLMEHEVRRVRNLVAATRPASCPAFAAFADEPRGVLELVRLRADTDVRMEVGDVLVAPILRQLERFPPSLVAVVDGQSAATYGAILDHVRQLDHLSGAKPGRPAAAAVPSASGRRKTDSPAHADVAEAVDALKRGMASGAYAQIYVAGPRAARSRFEAALPEALKAKVAGHLAVTLDGPDLRRRLRDELAGQDAGTD